MTTHFECACSPFVTRHGGTFYFHLSANFIFTFLQQNQYSNGILTSDVYLGMAVSQRETERKINLSAVVDKMRKIERGVQGVLLGMAFGLTYGTGQGLPLSEVDGMEYLLVLS